MNFTVEPICKADCDAIVTARHYSRRAPIFWAGFGLITPDGSIEGVCVYGQPSPAIQRHAFDGRDFKLYELSRLVIQTDAKNAASFLVGRSLAMLERPSAVVSYADTEHGHAGCVYQATNWIYTGATVSHDKAYIVNGERVHPMTLRDQGITAPAQWAKENGIATVAPMPKHRYFYLNGDKRQKRDMLARLRYPVIDEYPKMDQCRYDDGERVNIRLQRSLFD